MLPSGPPAPPIYPPSIAGGRGGAFLILKLLLSPLQLRTPLTVSLLTCGTSLSGESRVVRGLAGEGLTAQKGPPPGLPNCLPIWGPIVLKCLLGNEASSENHFYFYLGES